MRSLVLLALICMSPACDDEDGDPTTYVYIEDLPAAAKDAYCTYQVRCGLFPDQASCVASAIPTAFSFDVDTVAGIQAGKIQYNGSNMRRCLDALAAQTCDKTDMDGRVAPDACADLIQGRGKSGDACFAAAECASGYCSGGSSGDTCAAGQCVGDAVPPEAPVPVGGSCASNARCVTGARCDYQSTLTCVPLKAQGVACSSSDECDYGLGCAGTTTLTCIHLPTVGQMCSSSLPCRDEGQYCDTLATTPTCKQVGVAAATCTSYEQCSAYYPCDTATGKCTKRPTTGQSCSTTGVCFDAASFCDTTTYLCAARKGDGSMCTADAQCASNNCDTTISPALCTTETGCY